MRRIRQPIISCRVVLLLGLGLGLGLLGGACGDPGGKGQESAMPDETSADSWRNPTVHGEAQFGTSYQADFADGQLYHSWQFVLAGQAELEIAIHSQVKNMDTVLYLYRYDEGRKSWGSYLKRNDDDGQSMLSRIAGSYEAGRYKIMVKGYKEMIRGAFSLEIGCSGAGCEQNITCPSEWEPTPLETSLDQACLVEIDNVLFSGRRSSREYWVAPADRCKLAEVERLAVDYYLHFLTEYTEIEDEMDLGLEIEEMENGHLITVTDGGDESAVSYLFDGQKNLLAYYHHNQSPMWAWFCTKTGWIGPDLDDSSANETCLGYFLVYSLRTDEAEFVSGYETFKTALEILPNDITPFVRHYQNEHGFSTRKKVNYSFHAWTGPQGREVKLSLCATDSPCESFRFGEEYLYHRNNDNAPAFVCMELADFLQ